ncbi:MAG TPA: DEAD/DEAH box helicase family protein [Candidatus Polarisedimenticolaceae bacterium]|nr:DEAD/DEAH box helicase family protein [Candidatus Polarisedimenticolaceae bacterium]
MDLPPKLGFRRPWRPYQQRTLEALDRHLGDRRVHLVAAPGSGKTVLGIELFLRLGRPALVCSPTATIRQQWIERLGDFVADASDRCEWAGCDLERPGWFTSVTYQALHGRYRSSALDDEIAELPTERDLAHVASVLKRCRVRTLILDEAHHLRREWWKALAQLVERVGDMTIVSLTATPPYDALGPEWQRYQALCGPVDEEISVPELVAVGTLCPHQDYLYAVAPAEQDALSAQEHDRAVARLREELLRDGQLQAAIELHPWLSLAAPDPADVLEAPEFAVALLVWIKARGRPPSKALMRLLGCRSAELPELDLRWLHNLIDGCLHDARFAEVPGAEPLRHELARRLRRDGLLHLGRLSLRASDALGHALGATAAKIDACAAICQLERELRGSALRQVILTDRIVDDDVESAKTGGTRRLGAWPVFREILTRSSEDEARRVALLTGRLAVVHETRLDRLLSVVAQPLAGWPGFVRLEANSHDLVSAFTAVLSAGRLHVLVGTRSLLGEGWDAPSVNSLVLATHVGSSMLTNQMRGRALRIDPSHPDKTASLWHLVAVDPSSVGGRADLEATAERFKTFLGLAHDRPAIESGLARLQLPPLEQRSSLEPFNAEMAHRLSEQSKLGERWKRALESGAVGRVVRSVKTHGSPRIREMIFADTLRYTLYSAGCAFLAGLSWFLREQQPQSVRDALTILAAGSVVGLAWASPQLVRSLRVWVRHLPVDGSLREIARALYEALQAARLLPASDASAPVQVEEIEPGAFAISLGRGTFREQSLFVEALEELLGPVENPRYLITRRGRFWRRARQDYHAVPELLGAKRELAETFHAAWRRRIGPASLVYTRTAEGRQRLLRARVRAFSSAFRSPIERLDRWQ